MNIEIINVGTELLLGEIVNTNATYLQKICRDLGMNVYHQSVVGDNPQRLLECFDIAFQRDADCIMTTGGLGPTNDDLTKELSAQFLGLDMVYSEEEAKKVFDKCSFLSQSKEIAKANYKQAYFPENCYILENEVGTANGCVMSKDGRMIINLPGPPKEMTYVVDHELIPYLEQYRKDKIYTFEFLTMFIGESHLADLLNDVIERQSDVSIALYAGEDNVRIRLAVKAKSQSQADFMMEETKKEIKNIISPYLIHEKNLKEALMKIMVPYSIEYDGDFRLKDNFLEGQFLSDKGELKLYLKTVKKDLGEMLMIYINNELICRLPLLKKASYSYQKAEARVIVEIYKYLRQYTK